MNLYETSAVMDILGVAYPTFYRNKTDEEMLLASKLWAEMFADDDVRLVLVAVKSYIASDTKGFPPHIGAIKEAIVKLTKPPELELSEMEAWNLVRRAIKGSYMEAWSRKERYGNQVSAVYHFEQLPPLLQQIVGGPEQLAEWNKLSEDDISTVLQSNFMRSFRARAASTREYLSLPSDVRGVMQELGGGMKMELPEGGRGC